MRAQAAALAVLAAVAMSGLGCRPAEAPQPQVVTVPSGTPVKLVLLSTLTSGGSEVGKEVRLMVIESVVVDGARIIEAGTLVEGMVSRSRGATAVTTLINQPARLEAMLGTVKTVDSQGLDLSGRADAPAQPYAFTLDGTRDVPSGRVSTLSPEERDALAQMVGELLGPDPEKVLQDKAKRENLQSMAKGAGLNDLERSLGQVEAGNQDLVIALQALRASVAPDLVGSDLALALSAVSELGNLSRSIDRGLRGIFRGRNIEAGEGMLITGYTSAPAQVTIAQSSTR